MNEVDLLRREFETVPEPDDATFQALRAKLLEQIEGSRPSARRRRGVHIAAAAAIVLTGLLTGILTLVLPGGRALSGPEIAAAAYRAIVPPQGVIRHLRIETRVVNGARHEVTEEWVASGPFAVHRVDRLPDELSGSESEVSPCGEVFFDSRLDLLSVTVFRLRPRDLADYQRAADPIARFLVAYRSGQVLYRGQTMFRGIAAYKLVVSGGPRTTTTYIVRRDNYYPLQTVVRTKAYTVVTGYSNLHDVPRSARTEHLLHVTPHPDAFLLHGGGFQARGACAGFGSYDSLTGKGTTR